MGDNGKENGNHSSIGFKAIGIIEVIGLLGLEAWV